MTAHLATPIIGLTLLATVTTACSTTTAATSATGGSASPSEGSALAKEDNSRLAKGEMMGTGVGAASGAIYDVRKRK